MKKTVVRVIKKPILTEKSLQDAAEGKFTFEVELKADKKTIKKAVKEAFNVDVLAVRTRILKGKRVRIRGTRIERAGSKTKKATVTLASGQKIPVFETAK
ncbi:MAG: 50S ribosomal protein L23 [bacterium]|nr:50S ribosomal protein L23 [bacterium]